MKLSLRCLAMVLAVCASGAAVASFELMYLPDAETGKITRYDPLNKIVLGSFGFQDSGASWRTVSSRTTPGGSVFATNTDGTREFDPNTNVLLNVSSTIINGHRSAPSGNYLYANSGNVHYRYSTTLTSSNVITTSVGSTIGMIGVSDSVAWAHGINSAGALSLQRFEFGGSGAGAAVTIVAASSVNTTGTSFGMGARMTRTNGAPKYVIPYEDNTGAHRLAVVTMTADETATGAVSTTALSGFSSAATLSVLPSHNGYWVIGDDATSPTVTRIMRFDSGASPVGNFTTSAIDVPTFRWGGAIVLAPEPGAWIGLAFGAGLLGIRRRKR